MICTRCKTSVLRIIRSQANRYHEHRLKFRSHSSQADKSKPVFQRPQLKRDWSLHPMLSIPVVCFCLGWWQIERRKAKLQLIADIESRYLLDPVQLDCSEEYLEYTPVKFTGKFDYSKEFYLGPRHEIVDHRDKGEAGGYHSIVPFTLDSGQRILVDRGYVSNRTDSPVGQIRGTVTLSGYIRLPEGAVMASLAPASGTTQTYIWRDTEMMAKKADTLPISVELMSQHSIQGGPLAGQTRLSVYNKHVEYVITWWGMGLASLFYIINFKRKPKSVPAVFK
ncbi:hypothetical protein ACHWQZ_G013889 [Mnemiopsis leidyi]